MEDSKKVSFFGLFVWSLAIFFFFYEFFLRIFLGTIANEIRESLDLTIRQFSILAAAYYVTYGLMQIPVGILTEKIGTRIILSCAALICTIGVFFLGLATTFYTALIGRLLIGFGSSFAFVALLILALNWFPKKYFGFLCGISLFLGAVGPMLAGAPLAHVNHLLNGNWRLILYYNGIFGIILAIFLAVFIRDKPKLERAQIIFITPHEPLRKKLLELVKNRQAWFTVLCSGFLYCPMPILAAYFGTSYLQTRGFEHTSAAFIISMIWVGYAIGNPLLGKFSDHFKRRTPFLAFFGFFGALVSGYILYFSPDSYPFLIILFILLGLASSSGGLAFALIVEHTPQKLNSAALGFNNAGGMLFAALFPPIAGMIIESASRPAGVEEVITQANYTSGLSLIPLLFALASALALFCIKETFCRQQYEVYKLRPHKSTDLL
jgi:MFS family permease